MKRHVALHTKSAAAVQPQSIMLPALALQVHPESGHVLPYHVVATDYTSWALMYTTSASLGRNPHR